MGTGGIWNRNSETTAGKEGRRAPKWLDGRSLTSASIGNAQLSLGDTYLCVSSSPEKFKDANQCEVRRHRERGSEITEQEIVNVHRQRTGIFTAVLATCAGVVCVKKLKTPVVEVDKNSVNWLKY